MDDWDDDYHINDWNDDYLADGWDDDICPTCGGLGWVENCSYCTTPCVPTCRRPCPDCAGA